MHNRSLCPPPLHLSTSRIQTLCHLSRTKRVLKCLSCAHADRRIQAIFPSYSVHFFTLPRSDKSHGREQTGLESGPIFASRSLREQICSNFSPRSGPHEEFFFCFSSSCLQTMAASMTLHKTILPSNHGLVVAESPCTAPTALQATRQEGIPDLSA